MKCPKNHRELRATTIWHECTFCHGLWLTGKNIRKFLGRKNQKNMTLLQKYLGKPTEKTCPKDGTMLLEITVKGVAIDCCSQCEGVWFDFGELNSLKKSFEAPAGKPKRQSSNAAKQTVEDGFHLVSDFLTSLID